MIGNHHIDGQVPCGDHTYIGFKAPEDHFLSWHYEMYFYIPPIIPMYFKATSTKLFRHIIEVDIWEMKSLLLENKTERYSDLHYYNLFTEFKGIDYQHAFQGVNEHVSVTTFTFKLETKSHIQPSSGIISQTFQQVQLYSCRAINNMEIGTRLRQLHFDLFKITDINPFPSNDSCRLHIKATIDFNDKYLGKIIIPVAIHNIPSSISRLIRNVENKLANDLPYKFKFKPQILWPGIVFHFPNSRQIGKQYFPEMYYVLEVEGSISGSCLIAQLSYNYGEIKSNYIYVQDFPLYLPMFPNKDQCQLDRENLYYIAINTTQLTTNDDCKCYHCYIHLYPNFHNISRKENKDRISDYELIKMFDTNMSSVFATQVRAYKEHFYSSPLSMLCFHVLIYTYFLL